MRRLQGVLLESLDSKVCFLPSINMDITFTHWTPNVSAVLSVQESSGLPLVAFSMSACQKARCEEALGINLAIMIVHSVIHWRLAISGESGINARTFHGTMQWRVEELVANTSAAPLAPRCGVPEHQCSPCISNQPGHKVAIVQHAVLCQSWHRISTFSTAQIIYWSMERRWKGFTVLSLSLSESSIW